MKLMDVVRIGWWKETIIGLLSPQRKIRISKIKMIKINGNVVSSVISTGSNISIIGNKVFIDGQEHDVEAKTINIEVTGNVNSLDVDVAQKVNVSGNAGSVQTVSGSVEVGGDVDGSVSTVSGSVRAGKIGGNVSTVSGSVRG